MDIEKYITRLPGNRKRKLELAIMYYDDWMARVNEQIQPTVELQTIYDDAITYTRLILRNLAIAYREEPERSNIDIGRFINDETVEGPAESPVLHNEVGEGQG